MQTGPDTAGENGLDETRGKASTGAGRRALLLSAGVALGSGAAGNKAFGQSADTTPKAGSLASAFDGARFSLVAGHGGVPLNVVELGDPSLPSVLLVHGYRQSYLSWIYQFGSALKSRCHIVAFDLRGHGNSGLPWQPDAYDEGRPWADDANAVIKATGLKKPLVVGWSYGGNVVMDFARYHPETPVSGYFLVSTTGGFIKFPAPPANAPVRPTASPNLQLNIAAVDASTNFLFPASVDAGLRDQFKAAAMRVSPFVDQAIARRTGYDNLDLVSRLDVPVTFVFGGQGSDRQPRRRANPVLACAHGQGGRLPERRPWSLHRGSGDIQQIIRDPYLTMTSDFSRRSALRTIGMTAIARSVPAAALALGAPASARAADTPPAVSSITHEQIEKRICNRGFAICLDR